MSKPEWDQKESDRRQFETIEQMRKDGATVQEMLAFEMRYLKNIERMKRMWKEMPQEEWDAYQKFCDITGQEP